MRLAVLADIHGNADALSAVIADLAIQAPDLTVNLGDCLSGPLEPARTADLLLAQDWPTVRGNHDRWLVERPSPLGPWEADALPSLQPAHLAWLSALPATLVIGDVFLCHATPVDDLTYWLHHVSPEGHMLATPPDVAAHYAEEITQSLILCGHTHLARSLRLPDGRRVVNPGSVGCPAYTDDHPVPHTSASGTPEAAYAILDRVKGAWSVTFRQVPYDHSRASRLARAKGSAEWASALETGWIA